MARFQAGDGRAFGELYRRYIGRVDAYLRIALPNETDVADVAQHVFAAVFEALPSYRAGAAPFEYWLLRIVRNEAIDHTRRNRRTAPHEPEAIEQLREARESEERLQTLAWGSNDRLHLLMQQLPRSQRQVLVLHYLAGLSAGEIGAITGHRADAVRQLHRRALRFLETRLSLDRAASSAPNTPPPRCSQAEQKGTK